MNKYLIYIIIILITASFLFSCAQIGTLTGGLKDTLPPIAYKYKPKNYTTNFIEKKVIISFDEFFDLKEIDNKFFSSPPLEEKPIFKIRKRKLIIKFKEELKDSITYTLNFGNAIQDFHEGNPINNFEYVLSTSNVIDSFKISGKVLDAFDLSNNDRTFVNIYLEKKDSIPYLEAPSYLTVTDSLGNFDIKNIKNKNYKLVSFTDLNRNLKYDFGEKIGFYNDSLTPTIETTTITDTVKTGTILHDIVDRNFNLKITKDTVVTYQSHKYFPKNVLFFTFTEDNIRQQIIGNSREVAGKCVFSFSRPTNDSVKIIPLNFEPRADWNIIEKSINKDTITYWIKDTLLYKKDTLSFGVSYYQKDSTEQLVFVNDTVYMRFITKNEKVDRKRKKNKIKKKYVRNVFQINSNLTSENHDFNKNILLLFDSPIVNIDSSKIHLFEVHDTLVDDDREQKINFIRREKNDFIRLKLKRPAVNTPKLISMDKIKENWYDIKSLDSNKLFEYKITDSDIIKNDTVSFILVYDNKYYLDEIQKFSKRLSLGVFPQNIANIIRKKRNQIKIVFEKPIIRNAEIKLLDIKADDNWYNSVLNNSKDTLILDIIDKNISDIDSFYIEVKSFERKDEEDKDIFFEENLLALYSPEKQKIVKAERFSSDSIEISFNLPIVSEPKIKFLKTDSATIIKLKSDAKTILYKIIGEKAIKKDTLQMEFTYIEIDTIEKKDVFKLSIKPRNTTKAKKTVKINFPKKFALYQDSTYIRKYHIKHDWKELTNYKIVFDSLAFNDIFGFYNDTTISNIKIRDLEFYSKIKLKLTDIKADSIITDTNNNTNPFVNLDKSFIGSGNLIVQLMNKKEVVLKEIFINKDSDIEIPYIHPGEYILKIVFDKNNNKKWDTGNYLKKIQAERVMFYPKLIKLKTNWDSEIDWNIGKQLNSISAFRRPVKKVKK